MKPFFGNKFIGVAATFFVLATVYFGAMYVNGVHFDIAFSEAFLNFVLYLLAAFVLHRIHRFYHSKSAINWIHIGIISVFSLIIAFTTDVHANSTYNNDFVAAYFLEHLFIMRFAVAYLLLLTIVKTFWIDKHLDEQQRTLHILLEKERQLSKAEISNLQSQFQPHFLFNSLNSINALIKTQPDRAREMLLNLSEFLRLTLQKGKEEFNTIEDELNYLNLYLSIEKIRFGNRLDVTVSVDDKCHTAKIPSLILQPIIENAIKYGLNSMTGAVQIKIEVICSNPYLVIHIQNPYDETSISQTKGTGFGIKSVEQKLRLLFKRNDLLSLDKSNGTFAVSLKIPQL